MKESKYEVMKETPVIDDRAAKINALCYKVFTKTKDGKLLLELLTQEYIVDSPVANEFFRPVYGEHYVGIREGENKMLREFKMRAKKFEETEK